MDEHIKAVLDYLWSEEKRHYEEVHNIDLDAVDLNSCELDHSHIFHHLNEIRKKLAK